MPDTVLAALQMTLIGMSLVFAAIILMWGLMAALVRWVNDPPDPETPAEPDVELEPVAAPAREPEPAGGLAQRAAAVAVAIAVARVRAAPPPAAPPPAVIMPPTASVSAWQSVTRSRQLKQRGPIR